MTCLIKKDRFVLATNSDLEIYSLFLVFNNYVTNNLVVDSNSTVANTETVNVVSSFKIKLLKKFLSIHRDSILCLDSMSESLFASGSTDGHLIVWQSETLTKKYDLKPFDELNKNETAMRLSSTSIICFKPLNPVRTFFFIFDFILKLTFFSYS